MTPFEIIVSVGTFSIIICLGLIIWTLQQLIIKPIQAVKEQTQQRIKTEVKQAKIKLDSYIAETRIEPQVKTSDTKDDLDKLRNLKGKK